MARKRNIGKEWQATLADAGVSEQYRERYLAYVERMLKSGVPPIFEFRHLARLLGRTPQYLASVVNSPESHYRTFAIPKRSGGVRRIDAPYPALLECQQWINSMILARARVHHAAYGFVRRRSIKENAGRHLGRGDILKMDLRDFFPGIGLSRVIHVFRSFGYPRNVAVYLAKICCFNDVLPQGAATSPSLSNTIAWALDYRLSKLCTTFELNYSRYADDLTFSGKSIPIRFVKYVTEIVCDCGFSVNETKTRRLRGSKRRIVTGLNVGESRLTLPKPLKRQLRQEVHFIQRFGILSHLSRRRNRNPYYLQSLLGKVLYWKWIEPDNSFVARAEKVIRSEIASLADFSTSDSDS
jgi:RNA-directed DNA polymerase